MTTPTETPDPRELLKQAIAAGVTFAQSKQLYAERNSERDLAIIAKAREDWHVDGQVEIDDTTITSGSEGDGGDYVLAWVWVDFDDDDAADEGWQFYSSRPEFIEDLARISELVGGTSYESKKEDGNWYVRRLED